MQSRRARSIGLGIVSFFFLVGVAESAGAERRIRGRLPALKQRLKRLPGAKFFERGKRLHVAVKTGEAANKALLKQTNAVEFFVKKGYMHLFMRVKETIFDRHSDVKTTQWKSFKYKDAEQSGVLLELPRPLFKQLVKHAAKAKRDSAGTVGAFTMQGGTFPEQSNCTSWLTLALMGDKKLVEALGVPRDAKGIGDGNPTRHPQSFVNALIDHSPYAQAVIMRNHEDTSAEGAKIDFTVGSRAFVR